MSRVFMTFGVTFVTFYDTVIAAMLKKTFLNPFQKLIVTIPAFSVNVPHWT